MSRTDCSHIIRKSKRSKWNDSDLHSRRNLKITDLIEFEEAVKVSKIQNEIQKYMHVNVGHVDLNESFDWWKNYEDELCCL
jgi:hypothetical protein